MLHIFWDIARIYSWPSTLSYVSDISQAVKCNLSLYADDTCLFCQHKDINEMKIKIKVNVNKDFESICDSFVNNKLSIHFGEDKPKSAFCD